MNRAILSVLLLTVSCGVSDEAAPDAPIIIIEDEPVTADPAVDAPAPDDDDEPTCENREVQLALPEDATAVSVWDDEDAIYAAWVLPSGPSHGSVEWATFSIDDGRILRPATRAGAAVLADETNWAGGVYATSIAVRDGVVMVAWNSKSTTFAGGHEQPHSQVLVSRWDASGGRSFASFVASDNSYDDYVVDADHPRVRPRGDGFVVAWEDTRLNEPRRNGQQGWPWGIYQTTFDQAGAAVAWDVQVQQSPSIWVAPGSFDLSDDSYVFLTGREPHSPAFGGATQDDLDDQPDSLLGNSSGITAHHGPVPFMAWSSSSSSFGYLTAQRRGEEPFLVQTTEDDTHVGDPVFLEGGEHPQLAWVQSTGRYSDSPSSALFVGVLQDELVARDSISLPAGAAGTVLGGRVSGGVSRVIVRHSVDDRRSSISAFDLCPAPARLGKRLFIARGSDSLSVDGYDTASVSMNVSEPGTVEQVDLMMSGGRPEADWRIEHRGVAAGRQELPAAPGLVGQEARGMWTFSVTSVGWRWGFQDWALQLILSD